MTLYFENPVSFPESGSISVNGIWHPNAPLLAISSFSQDRGGFVMIFDELGEPIRDVTYPVNRSYQVTALAWHPERQILASGWENGELKVWLNQDKEFTNVTGPHKGPITLLEFSEKGGRLVSCDSAGSVIGWKVDSRGQISTLFYLEIKEQITHLTFRLTVKGHPDYDVEGLARAAVNGDEHALDMFSNWRPKTTARKFRVQDGIDNLNFYIATQVGSIYYVNGSGSCTEVLNTEGVPLTHVVYHPVKDSLIVMMEGLTIGHFSVDQQGHLTELTKVKLSGKVQTRSTGNQGLVWAGNSTLGVLTGDLIVRLWDIETNDNYVLPTTLKHYQSETKQSSINETFTCLSYCKLNQTLCAGTNLGRIYFWTKNPNYSFSDNPEDQWELNNVNTISGTIKQLMWGSVMLRMPLLSVNCVTSVYIMKEQSISTCFSEKLWCTQKTATQILLESENSSSLLNIESQVTDLAVNDKYLIFTNGRNITVYDILWQEGFDMNKKLNEESCAFSVKHLTTFSCENEGIALYDKTIIALTQKGLVVRSCTGAQVASLGSNSMEGEPIGMDVTASYLTVFTIEGFLKIYDLTEAEPKLLGPAKNLYELCPDFGEVIQAKTNGDGTKVAMTIAGGNLIPDGKLYILDVEKETITCYDFRKYAGLEGSLNNYYEEGEAALRTGTEAEFDEICMNRIPLNLFWDNNDARLLVCDAKRLKMHGEKKGFARLVRSASKVEEKKQLKDEDHIIITMFVSENGIKMHDIHATDPEAKLLGVSTPFIVTLQKLAIVRELMNDFNGLDHCNKATRDAVLDFSFHLSLGNMDAAFKAIKLVQSSGVWNSLARMCVKTRRLDVAAVCLGHMGDARAARALRIAAADASLPLEAKVAVLAVELGMLDEAEQLYIQCERYDLLNRLLRSRNKMDAALAIAESKDRIHLRNTEHAWGRVLEQNGEFKDAAVRYEKANTHRYDVPRMLSEQPLQLQAYMSKTKDKELLKWWGQYVESQEDMQTALKIYSSAGDIYSQVRVLCFLGEEVKAAELAKSNTDKAAFYHMARYYETVGNNEEAVSFFTKANAYSNAVRLAKENNMSEQLWNLGLVVAPREKIECAKYFEELGDLEKAVILYYRGGMLHKALDLAFKTKQFDVLQQISTDLDAESDPVLVDKCTEYFVNNEQFDKAVDLLAVAKRYKEAIDLCLKHNVTITEDLAEKLTPEKNSIDEETRLTVLQNLAESLMVQGDYHLATKKFTQSGNKVQAMKALLKSGDTDKIIFFAGISRQKEIYVMAANYLQSLDWQNQPEVLRNIINFYSKGKALDLLANFYVACAQVEIDEFQNYEKALGALTEASRCLGKVQNPKDSIQHQRAVEIVQHRLATVRRFVDIRKLFERGDFTAGMTQCKQLLMLGGQELEESVRRGDVYALMIQHCVSTKNFTEAKQLCGELKNLLASGGNIPITYYLNKELIEALSAGLGVPSSNFVGGREKVTGAGGDDEEVVEELND